MTLLDDLSARIDPPMAGADERTMLVTWLDFHRATLAQKCRGLSDEHLRLCSVPPSNLSLLGLVRHLTEVELWWFQDVLRGVQSAMPYWTQESQRSDFEDVAMADALADLQRFAEACDASRAVVSTMPSLDTLALGEAAKGPTSLRWILVHMIEEYARHNGHADFLRERIDGVVGD